MIMNRRIVWLLLTVTWLGLIAGQAVAQRAPATRSAPQTPKSKNFSPFRLLSGSSPVSAEQRATALAQLKRQGAETETERDPSGQSFLVITWNGADAGLEQLANLPEVRWLDLSRTRVT